MKTIRNSGSKIILIIKKPLYNAAILFIYKKYMFTKLRKNIAKKGLVTVWLIITTLYTVYGVYNYFKYQVYKAGTNAAITQVIADVLQKDCKEATQLFSGQAQVNLIDISCLQQAPTNNTELPSQ